uniref:Transmembrane protein 138 n=1 Tax=Mastacembelus armatus TaxID=205130 RepID=A0A7N8Y762_9TELE
KEPGGEEHADGQQDHSLQALFVFQRTAAVLYYYYYKRTAECMGDPRFYEDSAWMRDVFARSRQ